MRADRLLSLLMLLQARGRLSARKLAQELEVSERTIYRDVDALSSAGVPIYGEAGREGGYSLLDSYRTSLTGLTGGEVQALFMLSIPAPLSDLGINQPLKAALFKLSASLTATQREEEDRGRQRIHIDSTWWNQGDGPVPHLQILYDAIFDDQQVLLKYRPLPDVELEQTFDPYGLVAKAGVWFLVCSQKGRIHVHRVSSLVDVHRLPVAFMRPKDFDLAAFWRTWCEARENEQKVYLVMVRVSPGFIPLLPMFFGEGIRGRLEHASPVGIDGWVEIELAFESLEQARSRLLALGGGIEVCSPEPLRLSIADYAGQILARYHTG